MAAGDSSDRKTVRQSDSNRKHARTKEETQAPAKVQTDVVFIPWDKASMEDHVMEWNDEALEEEMRKETGIETGDIHLSDVWELTWLSLYGTGVTDISSLAELNNLMGFDLENTKVTDTSALSGLTNLDINQ